ncbi:ABC transporter ATP-binding protein [Mesorhizobium sp. M0136]|uniref:ABC transporter ATP-binding protein n=1 Tax=Mesorhizobium sp. M0136 TaxID=2956890 RepID=UPI00333B24AD
MPSTWTANRTTRFSCSISATFHDRPPDHGPHGPSRRKPGQGTGVQFYRFELAVPLFQLGRGKFYGLIGKSGSGKSTLLDLLAMVSQPTQVGSFELRTGEGAIDLADLLKRGRDAKICEVRLKHFGYILQTGGLFTFFTVRENLELPFRLSDRRPDREAIESIARTYELFDHLDKKPSVLSLGQRQRVSILRALCLRPDLVLADEPTASVDENMADIIVREFKSIAAEFGTTVLMVSHDTDLVGNLQIMFTR